ncbi:MAG: helicase-related protein [Candidatus Woesearchaeota archaeon]|nr:helicase-related protein [Candidatus Woesearchaeota archaeon]
MLTKKISSETGNAALDLALDTIKIGKQALVFANTKRSAEKTAEDIAKKVKSESKNLVELSYNVLKAISNPTKQCQRLALCIKKGIAFHHAGLVAKQRELVEDNFRNGTIKIICSTPTLAFGLDLPAFRAILKDLRRYGPRGMAYIPVLEYLQMAGRAGRPKFDNTGEAICIAISDNDKKKLYEKYILGEPEEIYSKLAVEPVLRTYLLSLIAANFVNTKKSIVDFFSKTFWAYQFVDIDKLIVIIDKMLNLLEEWEFIRREEKEDFTSADKINDDSKKIKATLMGKRVAELYIDPLTAYFFIVCLRNASNNKVKELSFLQMICHTLEIMPLLRVGVKEQEKIQEELTRNYDLLLEKEPSMYEPEYEDYINSVKTALMLQEWTNEKTEEYLLESYNTRPGELRSKLGIADWLLYASEEISRILNFQNLNKEIVKLRLRLKHGVREELLPLIKIKGVGRVRARKLYYNRIKDIGDVKKADIMKLSQILGKSVALNVKKQVGQEIKEVLKGKRKGQISLLRDY